MLESARRFPTQSILQPQSIYPEDVTGDGIPDMVIVFRDINPTSDDGVDEIITGPGPGADYLARVRGFNYDGGPLTAMTGIDFLAYTGEGSRYGVKVAGDRD